MCNVVFYPTDTRTSSHSVCRIISFWITLCMALRRGLQLGQLVTPELLVKIRKAGGSTDLSWWSAFSLVAASFQSLKTWTILHFIGVTSKNLPHVLLRWSVLASSFGSRGDVSATFAGTLLVPRQRLELGWPRAKGCGGWAPAYADNLPFIADWKLGVASALLQKINKDSPQYFS